MTLATDDHLTLGVGTVGITFTTPLSFPEMPVHGPAGGSQGGPVPMLQALSKVELVERA